MSCSHDPKQTQGPIGMYHCPECGEMVLAGMDHPNYSVLDEENETWKPMVGIQPWDPPDGWLGNPEEWPILSLGNSRYLIYAEIDDDWIPQLLSALPDLGRRQGKMTWIEAALNHEYDCLGAMMCPDNTSEEDWLSWCLEQGLCPGQWFLMEISGGWSKTYCIDFGEEWDFECFWKILDRERLSPAEHALRWIRSIQAWDDATRALEAPPILRDFLVPRPT